jgi:hypothetical protein
LFQDSIVWRNTRIRIWPLATNWLRVLVGVGGADIMEQK